MQKSNWVRIFLCGILTGAALYVVQASVFVFVLGNTQFAAAVDAAGRPAISALPFLLHLAAGIWTMWLYEAIRPRFGAGMKAASVTGLAIWVIAALVEGLWVSSRLITIPAEALLAPVGLALPAILVAVVLGAWSYEGAERRSSQVLKAA